MKKIISIFALLAITGIALAQGDYEAFRFSQSEYSGTARYMGAGGAFSATGGEFSALMSNPASIGLYKRHEVSFTPMSLTFSKNNTTYFGQNAYTQNPKYTVPECGLVIANDINNSQWKYWQFGFGYNRIMDYNNTFRADAPNISNTMVNTILDRVQGTPFNALSGDGSLAWSTWLIDTIPGYSQIYFSPFEDAITNQSALVKMSGSMDEMSFTFGGNYADKLYIGGTIGIPILDYREKISYSEDATDEATIAKGITSFKTTTDQQDEGGGINLKLGVIYQPVNFLRLGVGFQTPTYFWKIKDTYTRNMISYYIDGSNSSNWSYTNKNKFTLTTPLKFNIAASFLINKRAFVSAEYDFTDYSMAKLYSNEYNYTDENEAVLAKYGICHTLRLGAEVNLSSHFALRAGYNFKTSPYKLTSAPYNASAHYGSVGIGFKSKYFFADLAYVIRFTKDSYWLYEMDEFVNNAIEIDNQNHRIVATIGCKF